MNRNEPYRVEPIDSWDEYSEKVATLCNGWAFRGHADSTWQLMSTLGRYLNTYIKEEYWTEQEQRNLRIFQRKAHLFLTHIPEQSDTFQWLALMQHHGAPTRLLDFTWSPYVAAFFALERTAKQAAVWAVNPKRLVNVTESLNEFLENPLAGILGIGEPFVMNTRLIAQSGTFIVTKQVGSPIEDIASAYDDPEDTLVKFELPAQLVRPSGMRALFMMNITSATLFPDLDGLARSLAYELEFHWAHDPRKVLETKEAQEEEKRVEKGSDLNISEMGLGKEIEPDLKV
jgi:FRG domain